MSLLEDLKKLVAQTETNNIDSGAPPPNALARSCDARLLSALRGPDERGNLHYPLMRLKMLVTARIRWIVFQEDNYPGDVEETPMTQNNVDEVTMRCQELVNISNKAADEDGLDCSNSPHFLSHLADAVGASRENPIWGGVDKADEVESVISKSCRYG